MKKLERFMEDCVMGAIFTVQYFTIYYCYICVFSIYI